MHYIFCMHAQCCVIQIRVFIKALEKYPYHSYGLIDAPKTLADIVESTIGAIYIDSNSSIDTTWEVSFFSKQYFFMRFVIFTFELDFLVRNEAFTYSR